MTGIRSKTNVVGWVVTGAVAAALAIGTPAIRAADKPSQDKTEGKQTGGQRAGGKRNRDVDVMFQFIAEMIVEDFLAKGGSLEELPILLDELTRWHRDLFGDSTKGDTAESGTSKAPAAESSTGKGGGTSDGSTPKAKRAKPTTQRDG
jgi:hypothetical protein